jgi:hypothetical protein
MTSQLSLNLMPQGKGEKQQSRSNCSIERTLVENASVASLDSQRMENSCLFLGSQLGIWTKKTDLVTHSSNWGAITCEFLLLTESLTESSILGMRRWLLWTPPGISPLFFKPNKKMDRNCHPSS